MAKHLWSLAASKVVVDQVSGALSFFDIIEEIRFPRESIWDFEAHKKQQEQIEEKPVFALMPFSMMIASKWVRNDPEIPEKAYCWHKIVSPGGIEIAHKSHLEIKLRQQTSSRTLFRSNVFPFDREGVYQITVEYSDRIELNDSQEIINTDWQRVFSLPVHVSIR